MIGVALQYGFWKMTIEPLPPSSDLLEFVDDQRIEGGQGDNWQEPLVGMIRLKAAVTIMMLINNHLVSGHPHLSNISLVTR